MTGQDPRRPTGQARSGKQLSEEAVEQARHNILFGVGYRQPPAASRFRKGQSGNPGGRPKRNGSAPEGSRSTNALVLREAERLVTVREGDEVRKIPAIEAVHRAQFASAIRGNAYAQKHSIEKYDRAQRERQQQIKAENELWENYIAVQREAIAAANARGEAPLPRCRIPMTLSSTAKRVSDLSGR